MVKRYELSDAQWRRIADLLPGKVSDPGRTGCCLALSGNTNLRCYALCKRGNPFALSSTSVEKTVEGNSLTLRL
jgi:hypothetical protein